MLRPAAALLVSLVLVPAAVAEGIAVGPAGIVDPARQPYYVWIVSSAPEAPQPGGVANDCAAGARMGFIASARALAEDLASWDPRASFGGGSWFPTCVSGGTGCEPSGLPCPPFALPWDAYVSYNFATGRYYVELSGGSGFGIAAPAGTWSYTMTGTTGAGVLMDCLNCTPPVCCSD